MSARARDPTPGLTLYEAWGSRFHIPLVIVRRLGSVNNTPRRGPGPVGGILVVSENGLFHNKIKTLAGTSRFRFSKASQFGCQFFKGLNI